MTSYFKCVGFLSKLHVSNKSNIQLNFAIEFAHIIGTHKRMHYICWYTG